MYLNSYRQLSAIYICHINYECLYGIKYIVYWIVVVRGNISHVVPSLGGTRALSFIGKNNVNWFPFFFYLTPSFKITFVMESFDNPLKFRDWDHLLLYSTGHSPVILNSDCSVIVFLFCLCFIKKNKSVDHSLYPFQGAEVSLGNTMSLSI